MLITDIQPAFIVYGHDGSLIKDRADTQEEQLLEGMKPLDEGYGIEPDSKKGRLTTIDVEGNKKQELIESAKGDYTDFFESLYQSLSKDIPFPIQKEQVLIQLEILEAE